jgi:hypothetical protein
MNEKRVIIEEIKLYEGIYTNENTRPLLSGNNTLNDAIDHISLKPEGKKPMGRKEFFNGYMK